MADNLIFPIGFDLQKAVEKAGQDWDKTYAKKLETYLAKRPIKVKLNFENLTDVKARLAQLKIDPITPKTKASIKELARELQVLAKALEQVQKYSKNPAQLGQQNFRNDVQLEKLRQANERLEIQKRRVALAEQKHAEAMKRSASASKQLSSEYQTQEGYISRLVKRLAVYASFSAVSGLLTNIRQVTAEFELQRVSLGAIIQDQTRANQLFSEIKAFALKSPLKILDLTKYTKQVAAYRIETDKLFDTTKRLADVSVGLGVDMGRLVLAYGQVKAASYLRAAEIRQFTEAGIPLLELLAEKFTELQGSAVSTEEVMDKVSKRMVSFGMVEEIFKDMTDAGGIFYNMQEKQSQTLYGMWAKMGDAAAVMYEQMGNTATANQGMKGAIQLLSDMMLHWTALANVAQTAAIGFLAYKAAIAGLIPFYGLQTKLTVNQIKAEKAKQAQQIKTLAVGRALTREEQLAVMSKNKLMAADYKRLLTEGKLSAAKKLSLGRQAASNVQLRRAILELNLFTKAQITALGKMSGWQFFWAKFKLQMQGIGQAFVNLGRTMMAFAPLAAITAAIDLFMDWRQAVAAQEEAVKKVEKQYEETKVTLMQIENAYRDIQNASKAAGESEEEFAKTSYSQKLEQLQKVIKLLGQFGMKNVIDPSVLDYTNIDPVLDKWLGKLNEVNELARGWGRDVALVANAYEGNIMGWSIFGENLKEDMKDLERAWTKLTVNSEFSASLEQLRAIVGKLSNDNKQVYENISRAIGADLKLALGQKRRNESELQYQQRIYKNYQNIESYLQTYLKKGDYKGMLPSLSSEDVSGVLSDFQSQVDEVMHEFDKVKDKFRGQDALTVKMAIDTVAAENDWTEWQKELLIQHLNEDPVTLNAEIIPTANVAGQGAVAEGLKAIITSEFPTLFNENELQSLVSAEGIVEAIKTKLDASNESLEKSVQLQNNIAYGSKGFENSLKRVKQLQDEITEVENMRTELAALEAIEGDKTEEQLLRQSELQAKLAEVDEASINTKRAQIAAIVEANAKYDEQIKKQRESAEAEREIAKAALDRVSSMGLSDLGKDVKEQFSGLMVDAVKEITDKNYSTDFLISDEALKKVRDVGDLYDTWAKNTKAIKDEKEKLVGVGITEATIEKERAALEEKKAKIQLQLSAVEKEITDEKFKGQEAEYAKLKLALANATTAEAQKKARENLNKFLGDTKNAEFAILMLKKEGLKTTLQETLVSEAANNQIADYVKGLDDAEKLWEELAKRYGFKLPEKNKGPHGGNGEDPWILLMKNRMKFMQDFQKGVEDLSKWMGYTKGLADEQENMLGRGLSLKIDSRKLDGTKEELIKWYEDSINEIRKRIAKLGGKEWEGLGVQMILAKDTKSRVLKKYQELLADMFKELTDFRTDQTQKALEAKIKELADRISRTKTAKEFYDKILEQTGNIDIATRVSMSIYGSTGEELFKDTVKQIREAFKTGSEEHPIDLDISAAIDLENQRIDYKKLADIYEKYQNEIIEKRRDTAKKIAQEGQKEIATDILNWRKSLAKAKSYEQKRTDIINTATAERAKIIRETTDPKERGELLGLSYSKQAQELAKLAVDEFKSSDDYIKVFQDLDRVSTQTLDRMKKRLEEMIATVKDTENVEGLKTLVEQLDKIKEERETRNPIEGIIDSFKEYAKARKDYRTAEAEEAAAKAEFAQQEVGLNQAIRTAKAEQAIAQQRVNDLKAQGKENTSEGVAAELVLNEATKRVTQATENRNKAVKKVNNAEQKTTDALDAQKAALAKLQKNVNAMANAFSSAASSIKTIADMMGIAEDSELGDIVNGLVDGLNNAATIMTTILAIAIAIEAACWWMLAIGAAVAAFSAIGSWLTGSKVRKANKEIERQQELLDQLEYTYGRLEKAADKLFGRDYVDNYNQQLKNLQAQQQAYLKQAEAERSKGKKEDKEKTKEYEEQARETANKIKELQDDLVAHFTGSTKTDVARQMAKSWIDARASMSDTFAAIKGDYQDLIKNMIVEGAAARVIENALTPVWDSMQKMLDKNDVQGAIDSLVNGMDSALSQANNGMEVLWKALEARGYDMKSLISDTDSEYSGIAKSVAGATSEEINNVAAIGNTLMYYVSPIPRIDENLARVVAIMEGKTAALPTASGGTTGAIDYTDMFATANQHLSSLPRMEQHLAEIHTMLGRALRTKGSTTGFNTFLNS